MLLGALLGVCYGIIVVEMVVILVFYCSECFF